MKKYLVVHNMKETLSGTEFEHIITSDDPPVGELIKIPKEFELVSATCYETSETAGMVLLKPLKTCTAEDMVFFEELHDGSIAMPSPTLSS